MAERREAPARPQNRNPPLNLEKGKLHVTLERVIHASTTCCVRITSALVISSVHPSPSLFEQTQPGS